MGKKITLYCEYRKQTEMVAVILLLTEITGTIVTDISK